MSVSGYAQAGRDSQLGGGEVPSRTGMYEHASSAVGRIAGINSRINALLARLRGSQPEAMPTEQKMAQPPPLLQVGLNLHSEIDLMDKQLSELGELIG